MTRRGRRIGPVAAASLALAATCAVTVPLVRLHTPSPLDRSDTGIVADALPRLAYLRGALDDGAGEDMQALFPEGYFFTHALYGLSWVDVGARSAAHRPQALREARRALARLDSPAGRAGLDPAASPPYGVFHAGWSTWLRTGVVRLAGGPDHATDDARRLTTAADQLADAFEAALRTTGSPYLPAYPGQAWPVDSVVGLAALRLAGTVAGHRRYDAVTARWAAAARARLDAATGLLPHRVDPTTGRSVEGARGSSQALLLRFLPGIDPAWAVRDYRTFRRLFTSTVPGLPGVREHPRGTDAGGDVDSGPLLFGMSGSASAVALGTAVVFRDRARARQLAGLAEVTGLGVTWDGRRRHLGGLLPVADAFLVWSSTARPVPGLPGSGAVEGHWRLPWYAAAAAVLLPWWTVVALVGWLPGRTHRRRRHRT